MIQGTHYNEQNFGKWDYQDLDYILLSHILEKASGQSYETLFNDMYVYPLKLKHTDFVWADQQKLKEIDFLFNGQNIDLNAMHGLLGASSVAMSNDDLYKVSLDLLNGKLLSSQNKDIIYAPGNNTSHYRGGLYTKNNHYESNGNDYGYCNFLRISKDGQMQWFCKVQIAVGMAIWVIALIKFMRIYLENEIKTKSEDYNCNPRLFVSKPRIKRLLRMTPGLMGVFRCVVFYIFIEGKPINFSIWYHNNTSFLKYILK